MKEHVSNRLVAVCLLKLAERYFPEVIPLVLLDPRDLSVKEVWRELQTMVQRNIDNGTFVLSEVLDTPELGKADSEEELK